ncbi:MAG: BON domain-containing protein, partial [Chloroflexota bacterium]
ETQPAIERTDLDILSDIEHLLTQYPPLMKDRHAIKLQVKNGDVTVTGHVQTPNTRRYFLDMIPEVEGVRSVEAEGFYVDENIRLDIGRVLPAGVLVAKIQHGVVILAGSLPAGSSAESVVKSVGQIAGVVEVIPSFR